MAAVPSPAADVVVCGNLTAATRGLLHHRLRQVVTDGVRHVRVDLSGVESLDPAAATVLLLYRRLLPPLGGELILVAPSGPVEEALMRMRLDHLLGRQARRRRWSAGRTWSTVPGRQRCRHEQLTTCEPHSRPIKTS